MADITKILKFISVDSESFELVDNTVKVQNRFDNIKNAIVYDHDKHILYFLDSENDGGTAQQINAPNEYPLTISTGSGESIDYNGSEAVVVDVSTLHRDSSAEEEGFKTIYANGTLTCPFIEIDQFGHITNTSSISIKLTGDNDASLVTVSAARILFGEFASKYEVKVIGKDTEIGYVLPGTDVNTGQTYKCIDGHEYYYADGVTKIQYEDEEGNLKNPGAGDIIICDSVDPIHWSVIANQNDVFSDVITGLVPASGESNNGLLYGDATWRNLIGGSGITIGNDNQTISHTNEITAGTGGNNEDVIDIPHYAKPGHNVFSFVVPRFVYDGNGHITGVKDCSVNIEVCDIEHGEFPTFTVRYKNAADNRTVETIYNPEVGDQSMDLSGIKAELASDSEKFGGKTVSTLISDFTSSAYKDNVIPVAGVIADFVREFYYSNIDTALSTTSENPVQNKIISTALNRKADLSSVLGKTNTIEYVPTGDYNPATKKYVDDGDSLLAESKQDKLVPGIGVNIEEGIISFNADLFKVVDGYIVKNASGDYRADIEMRVSNPVDDKVYIVRLKDSSSSIIDTPIYVEFTYDVANHQWVQVGEFQLDTMIEDKFKSFEIALEELKNEHVFMSEEAYETLRFKDPTKIYMIYEDDEPYIPGDEIDAKVEGDVIDLTMSPDITSYDPLTKTISISSSHIRVENDTIIID